MTKINFQQSDAWMLLSVEWSAYNRYVSLRSIISTADYINHSIPTEFEIEGGFTRLLQAGLIKVSKRRIGTTQKGLRLVDSCGKKGGPMKIWDRIEEKLKSGEYTKIKNKKFKL